MPKKTAKKIVDKIQRIKIINPAGRAISLAKSGLVPQSRQPMIASSVGDSVIVFSITNDRRLDAYLKQYIYITE